MTEKWVRVGKLLSSMRDAGLWSSRISLYQYEKAGKLTLPKNAAGHRVVPVESIEEIVAAFSPEGNGEWHYKR